MDDARELTVNEIGTLKLVSVARSIFQDRINSTKLGSRKTFPKSEEEKSLVNDRTSDVSEENKNGGTNVKSERVIDVKRKSDVDMRNQLIKIHEKISGIEKEVVQKNGETSRKINEIRELTVSVDAALSNLNRMLNELHVDHKQFMQVLFDYTKKESVGNFRKEARKEVSESEEEVIIDDDYVSDTLKEIAEIDEDVKKLLVRASSFSGDKNDLNYLDIGFKLLENIMKIDVIQAHEIDEIRHKKKEVIELADRSKLILDNNLTPE